MTVAVIRIWIRHSSSTALFLSHFLTRKLRISFPPANTLARTRQLKHSPAFPQSALKNPKAKAEGKKNESESKPKRYEKGEIPPPIASSKADRYMLGVLINHGIIPDLRIRNHRQKYEAQERRKQRMVIYDRIPELYASGMPVRAIAKELKISVPTVYEQAKVRGLDIVEKEQQAFRVKNLTAQRLVEMGYQKQKVAELMGVNRNTVFNALNRTFDSVSEEDLMLIDKAVNKLIGRVEVIVETPRTTDG